VELAYTAGVNLTVTALDGHGVSLLPPTAPEFDRIARPLIGERVADLALGLKPMLTIVSNAREATIVSFSVVWHVTHPSGTTRCWGHASFPKAVCGDVLAADEVGLRAGDRWVHARQVAIHGWGDNDAYYDQFLGQFVDQEKTLVVNASDLRIELNAVIFADGTLAGPDDDAQLSTLFATYVGAKQAWYRQIVDVFRAGGSVEDAFRPLNRFQADLTARMADVPFGSESALWEVQAAAEARQWLDRLPAQDLRRRLEENIRLEPFVIRRE
jgi:hypothetical protein